MPFSQWVAYAYAGHFKKDIKAVEEKDQEFSIF